MADGVGVEWVQTSKPGLVSRAPEEFEGELRELRDEVRRLREQVAALAAATARPPPVDERLPTFVGRLDPFLEGGVPRGSVLALMVHLEDARNDLFHFFHFLRGMGITTYVIANVEPSGGGISHDVSFLSDGVFELRFSGAGEGKVQLLFRCAKMRHTNHSRDYFVLTYDKGFAARPYEAPRPSRWGR